QPPCSSSAYGPSFQKCHRHQPRANTPNDGQMLPVANATMPQAQANKTMERAVRMSHTISEKVSPLPFRTSPQISSTAKEPRAGTAHFTQPAGAIRRPAAWKAGITANEPRPAIDHAIHSLRQRLIS